MRLLLAALLLLSAGLAWGQTLSTAKDVEVIGWLVKSGALARHLGTSKGNMVHITTGTARLTLHYDNQMVLISAVANAPADQAAWLSEVATRLLPEWSAPIPAWLKENAGKRDQLKTGGAVLILGIYEGNLTLEIDAASSK